MENTINPGTSPANPPAKASSSEDESSRAASAQGAAKPLYVSPPETRRAAKSLANPAAAHRGRLLLQAVAALCGTAAGAVVYLTTGEAPTAVVGDFAQVFLHRAAVDCAFLLLEYVLAFFAPGEWLVWLLPLTAGMGAGLGFAAGGSLLLLPAYAIRLAAVTVGAAFSAQMSAFLMNSAVGGRPARSERRSAAGECTLRLIGCAAAVAAAAALYAGAQ